MVDFPARADERFVGCADDAAARDFSVRFPAWAKVGKIIAKENFYDGIKTAEKTMF